MKDFVLSLFLFIIWWSIVIASVDDNDFHVSLELQTTHQGSTIHEKDLNADKNMINMSTVNFNQEFFYTDDLNKICHAQVNEFVWKCHTINETEDKFLKFGTTFDHIYSSNLVWYLKSINEIDIIKMAPRTFPDHQIEFLVSIDEQKITLNRLYPTYPKISGFEILQFIAILAFQCNFRIDVIDSSDISPVYSKLYGKTYYEYQLKGSQKFLFQKIIVKKKTFLDCFEEKIRDIIENLSESFYENIKICKNTFISVEFCPIMYDTQRIVYQKSFQYCINWSEFQSTPSPFVHRFRITSEDIDRMMNKKKRFNLHFVQIFPSLDKKILKTYDQIKTQIFDTSVLMKLFSQIFELCFFELEKRKSYPNPEDIFKLYLRPCVIPNINLALKYYTNL